MTSNQNIERSRRVYARMLYLFPREHREEYGTSMLQVFTDQLREVGQKAGVSGFIMLWLRTLWDLGISAIKEQFSPPHLTIGLLEAVPNQPLPWKGVVLVLFPGLAFFIAQLVQLSGEDWFYWMIYRAGYYLILPVLIVWMWQRKFPLWGLVPLGLLFHTLWSLGYRIFFGGFLRTHPELFFWLEWGKSTAEIFRVAVICVVIVTIITLLILFTRRQQLPHKSWYWLAGYIILCIAYVGAYYLIYSEDGSYGWPLVVDFSPSILYESIGFLVLILLGTFFTRRHGHLTMLLLMGYLLPTVVFGRFSTFWNSLPENTVNTFLTLITVNVFVYRLIIALAAPIWVVRSATPGAQHKVSRITLLICVAIQIVTNIGVHIILTLIYQNTVFTWLNWYVTFAAELVVVAGIGLATTLYSNPPGITQSELVHTHIMVSQ